jgi:AraC-like DNA-binding protein
VLLWGARAAYVGPALHLAAHTNAVAVLALGLGAPFRLTTFAPGGEPRTPLAGTRVALVPPRTRHRLDPGRGPLAFVYLDPLGDDRAALRGAGLPELADATLADLDPALPADALAARLVAALGLPRPPPPRAEVAAVIRAMDGAPDRFPSVQDAAAAAGLSSSRFQRHFRLAAGVPFRRYRLWRRMALAAEAAGAGSSLTEAAYAAGFSSAAHFSAAFRAMFGLAPSALFHLAGARVERCG